MYTWWEQTDDGQEPIAKEPVKCPVCKKTLGTRVPDERLWIRCEECKTDFYYPPYKLTPTRACPDSMRHSKGCGCGRCGN